MAMRRLKLKNRGFVEFEPRRWFCSEPPSITSSSSKVSKENEAVEEKRTLDSDSSIKRFMLSRPKIFPEVTEVQEKVGGSRHMLRDILTDMKSKMLPNSQINGEMASEENITSDKFDGLEKESILLSGVSNVEKLYISGVEDSKDPSSVKISENAEFLLPKHMEHSTKMLDVEKSLTAEAKDAEDLFKASVCDEREIAECKLGEQSVEIRAHAEFEGSEDRCSVKIPNNAAILAVSADLGYHNSAEEELITKASIIVSADDITEMPECKLDDKSVDFLGVGKSHAEVKNSEDQYLVDKSDNAEILALPTDLGQHHVIEEELSTRASISNAHSSKLTKSDSFEKGKTNAVPLEENFPSGEKLAYEKKCNLFDFLNKVVDKGTDLNRRKIDAQKHEMSGLKDNSHVIRLVDIFKRNQKDSADKLSEKMLERDEALNMKESEAKGLFDRIIEASKNSETSESSSSLPLGKVNKFNRELCFSSDSIQLPSFDKGYILNKPRETNSLNLGVNNETIKETEHLSEESDSNIAAFHYPRLEQVDSNSLPFQRTNSDATPNNQMGSFVHRLLVKFLVKTAIGNDLRLAFSDCGPISQIRIINSGSLNRFNYAYIFFKTAEGLKRALSKQDVSICGTDVITEPDSLTNAYTKIASAESVTDLDFPSILLNNPSRTALVKGLPEDRSFHYLLRYVSSWGHVSSIALGSSPSNAYLEFESEEVKEKAIAQATVSVSGKKLPILRIDAPKTTVVRISNVNSNLGKIRSVCDSYGKVKKIVSRDTNIFDVHFSSSEYPNMVKILNRLNGQVVDRQQWIAQPATVIPTQLLQSIWNDPEGRKHVHEMIQRICRKIEANSISTAPMLGLAQKFYGDD